MASSARATTSHAAAPTVPGVLDCTAATRDVKTIIQRVGVLVAVRSPDPVRMDIERPWPEPWSAADAPLCNRESAADASNLLQHDLNAGTGQWQSALAMDYDHFIADPGSTNVATTGAWAAILKEEKLQPGTAAAKETGGNADVSIDSTQFWSGVKDRDTRWSHKFSSQGNGTFFNDGQSNTLLNNAWTGDDYGSGVMLLDTPASDASTTLDEACDAFSVSKTQPSATKAFLDALASNVTLKLRLLADRGSSDAISGVWCTTSEEGYCTRVSLLYELALANDTLSKWMNDHFDGLDLTSWTGAVSLAFTEQTAYTVDSLAVQSLRSTVLTIGVPIQGCQLYVDLSQDTCGIVLRPPPGISLLQILKSVFGKAFGNDSGFRDGNNNEESNIAHDIFSSVQLGYVYIVNDLSQPKQSAWNWGVGLVVSRKTTKLGDIAFSLLYDSATTTFQGNLLLDADVPSASDRRDISYDPRFDLPVPAGAPPTLNLLDLFDVDIADAPFPTEIAAASVSLSKASGSTTLGLHARFTSPQQNEQSPNVPFPFTWDEASIDITKTTGIGASCTVDIITTFTLVADGESDADPATFGAGFHYGTVGTDTQWVVHAYASDLSVGLLRSFFSDQADRDGVDVMDKLTLSSLEILYAYTGGATNTASSFLITGVLELGDLELDLIFQFDSQKGKKSAASIYEETNNTKLPTKVDPNDSKSWKFEARLSVQSQGATISSIAQSIVPGAKDRIPGFVGDIFVNPATPASSGPVALVEYASSNGYSVLSVWLSIAGFSFTFLQFSSSTDKTKKRAVRISVDQIPEMDKIPLIGQMPQPFDHLEYVWVEHDVSEGQQPVGITAQELQEIGKLYPSDEIPPFQVKPVNPKPTDVVLAAGHHFIVVVHGQVVLDHVFDTNNVDSRGGQKAAIPAALAGAPPAAPPSTATVPTAQPTKGDATTTAGPLSISALTIQFQHGTLVVSVDATLRLGPLTFSVIGFTLGIDLARVRLDNLASIVTEGLISASLHGLEVGVTQGPLTLAGVFIHDKTKAGESYRGGIAVGFKAWQVLAVGEYYISFDGQGNEQFRSVFVYGKLDGPLIELEFATISGVRLGFGYNYSIRMPGLSELWQFPLISDSAASGAGDDPMKVLSAMVGTPSAFVWPKEGSGWFAAGMTITAFDVVTLTAVIVIDIDTGATNPSEKGVILALFADGVFQMEPLAPADYSLFYVELLVKVELNFVYGYVAADAALAPASHIYVPFAHLVGSASFYTWFDSNPHAGDWVVTIGGYARAYKPVDWYPKADRIGVSFTVGDMIHVVGNVYAAVTPQCAMAGGMIHLSLDVGPVSAYMDVLFDCFINFKPFHFRAEMSISVGVECDIDILFIHIHVSISIGADLVLWGPHDFGGHAHVDFWFFGFDIGFGADENPKAKDPISLSDFCAMVIKPGPESAPPSTDTVGGVGDPDALHKYTIENGLAPQKPAEQGYYFPSTGATTDWHVLAGTLSIRVDCSFALSGASLLVPVVDGNGEHIKDEDGNYQTTPEPIILPFSTNNPVPAVYSFPMHTVQGAPLTSTVTVSIYEITRIGNIPVEGFHASLVTKTASPALWTAWDSALDPLYTPQPDHLLNPATNTQPQLVQAIRLTPPDPFCCPSAIVEFDAAAAMRSTISGGTVPTAAPPPDALGPEYFDPPVGATAVSGPQRWGDFQAMWRGQETGDARATLLTGLVEALEWAIRPPEQMAKNTVAPATGGAAGGGSPDIPPTTENAPRVNADGRTDWELETGLPGVLIAGAGEFYPALPWVCAGA